MDTFLEYLMRKKTTGKDVLCKLLLVMAAVFLCVLLVGWAHILGTIAFFGIVAVVYGLMVLLRRYNLEYEYIFTNGDLDVDVIQARQSRKRLISLSCKDIEVMASAKNADHGSAFENPSISKKYDAVFDYTKGGIYHILFVHDGEQLLLTFQPPAKLLAAMQKMNPRCVFVDAEDKEKSETEAGE